MSNLNADVIESPVETFAIYVKDADGNCVYASKGYEKMPGSLRATLQRLITEDSVAGWEGHSNQTARALDQLVYQSAAQRQKIIASVEDGHFTRFPERMSAAAQRELKGLADHASLAI